MEHPKDERASPGPESDLSFGERFYLREAIKGMAVLAKHFWTNLFGFRDPAPEMLDRKGPGVNMVTTINYPEERKPYPPGYRGMHRLVPRVDGRPRCVACYMCATACPAHCIHIVGEQAPWTDREKYPIKFDIDELRCIYCGMCEEACPVDAIELTYEYDMVGLTRSEMIFDKEKLLRVFDETVKDEPM